MEVDVRLVAALLIFAANIVFAQERCSYMVAIPREDRPDLPDEDFTGLSWNQRPFLPAFDRKEVCMDMFVSSSNFGTQLIYMEEEIEGDVVIAKLNYHGPAVPEIVPTFLSGTFNMLRPVIRRIPADGGDWHLVITQRQDYELPGMQQYMFNVRVAGETMVPTISLQIVNIDDNRPVILVFEACEIPETEEPGLTDCVYEVQDADGYISTGFMTFTLESNRNDLDFFILQPENIPGEWFKMYLKLKLNATLNFEVNALHVFRVTAFDSLPNNHTATIMVQVQNVESRSPRWVEIFAMQQFDEKQARNFTVMALDGDTDIDRPIFYRLETAPDDPFFDITTIEGGRNGSIFFVSPIDRDELEREVFQLTIIAYKNDDNDIEAFSTRANVVIMINDINDQKPRPFQPVYNISIDEETALTLDLQNFGFHDRDLGEHAVYSVELVADDPPRAVGGFQVTPTTGYQRQSFIMTTLNHRLLDYEDEDFRSTIQLRVIATDQNITTHVGEATVYIDLLNWNDEVPIFASNVQTVRFNETVPKDYYVGNVTAFDRDIDDRVVHELLGNAGGFLRIDPDTGEIFVSIDNAFDYHRQNELFVQVQATDTLGDGPFHTATSQLVIQLIDINNTPPNLRLPRSRPEVEENVPKGFEIKVEVAEGMAAEEITATDQDTDAKLVFEIDWETSYATKQGRQTPAKEFHDCVEIVTVYPDPDNTRVAIGKMYVKEIRHNVTLDFEEFEILYVTVRVRDLNTEIGPDYDVATYTIIIIDMNDNMPLWAEGTLTQEFRVRERSDSGVVIGSVLATDIDGPLYNQVRYTILTREDTPENLVKIDFFTGQITVDMSDKIDADEPRYNLYYTLVASDGCYAEDIEDCPPDRTTNNNEGNITIRIIDTNNRVPVPETKLFNQTVFVWENATSGDVIANIIASDADRDEMYHEVSYQIDYRVNPRLRAFFEVNITTGEVYVEYTTDETLDRDGDEPTHTIFFILSDNFLGQGDGNRNQETTEIEVILLDVNDNAPELPAPHELSWPISENTAEGVRILPEIYAPDRDEPDTDNSRVGYAILNLSIRDRDINLPELFTMVQIKNVTGELETVRHLQGYWGTYDIHIRAFDHGYPQQCSEETYKLVISPYNFHDPVFVFPQPNTLIRIAREQIAANGVLITVQNQFLDRIHATDEDGLEAGIVNFQVVGNADAIDFFEIRNEGDNFGSIILQQTFEQNIREFTLTIRATDSGLDPGPRHTDVTFTLAFVPTQGEPIFENNTANVSFFEEEEGMSERFELPLATDLKNHLCIDDCHSIYYAIVPGNDGGHFAVESTTNVMYLVKPLNRSESAQYTVLVAASNSPNVVNVLPANTLTVTVNVREANPRPIFERALYTAGISVSDVINRNLLTVQATHSEDAPITYTIDYSTMNVHVSLEAVKDTAFILNSVTGVLTLNIQPTAFMHGLFDFQIVATDPTGAHDRTQVKIYLISSQNRVTFRFRNTLEQIEEHSDFIAQTLTAAFRMTCNVDQIVPATDSDSGTVVEGRTDLLAHFIRNNIPVDAEDIERLRSDVVLIRSIQDTLRTELVVLEDFVTDGSPDVDSDNTQITVYVLIALTAVLGLLCFILLLTFIIRTRALNRRLEALSMTKYGSVDSGLNRMGITPGTNKHAVEGSNPIWNETLKAPDFDALSNASNDSDLIGIEDLPQFRNDYFPPEDNNQQSINNEPASNIASHSNNFGFNASPFSPDFGNKYTGR